MAIRKQTPNGPDGLPTRDQVLAFISERLQLPADLSAMVRHRRAAWALMGLAQQGACPICTEDIPLESPGIVTLGCYHVFHK